MPGNDLTASRALVPQSTDTRATARANLTTLLTNILDDIEPKVTAAQIDISSDLDYLSGGTRYAAKNVAYVNLEDRTSGSTVSNESAYVKNDEFYFKDGSGNEVQLTSGGSAVAGSSGDITGSGYGSTGVEINWNTATAEYRFKAASGASDLADLVMDKARFDDGGATFATLGAPGSMAATIDFLLPGTHPASTALMTLTSAGAMGHTRDPSVDSLTLVNDIAHGNRTVIYHASIGRSETAGNWTYSPTFGAMRSTSAGDTYVIPIKVPEGMTIDQIDAEIHSSNSGTRDLELYRGAVTATGTPVQVAVQAATDAGAYTHTISGIAHAVTADDTYWVKYTTPAASTDAYIKSVKVTYSRT